MNESAIHISSVKREAIGTNKPHDFLVKFNPPLKLDPEYRHFLAPDRLSMSYSWYNIRSDYKNNTLKYTHDGSTWHTITIPLSSLAAIFPPANGVSLKSIDILTLYQSNGVASPVLSAINLRFGALTWAALFAGSAVTSGCSIYT